MSSNLTHAADFTASEYSTMSTTLGSTRSPPALGITYSARPPMPHSGSAPGFCSCSTAFRNCLGSLVEWGRTVQPFTFFFSQFGLAGVLETFGGLLMVLGLFARPVALVLALEMLVAFFQFHGLGDLAGDVPAEDLAVNVVGPQPADDMTARNPLPQLGEGLRLLLRADEVQVGVFEQLGGVASARIEPDLPGADRSRPGTGSAPPRTGRRPGSSCPAWRCRG